MNKPVRFLQLVGLLSVGAQVACSASPDDSGWYGLGDTAVRIWAGALGPGCLLTGDPYPAADLDPDDPWRGDPSTPACDAYLEWSGPRSVVFSAAAGGLHPEYDKVALQPLFIRPTTAYLHMQGVDAPGGFTLPIVLAPPDNAADEKVYRLRVEALEPEG